MLYPGRGRTVLFPSHRLLLPRSYLTAQQVHSVHFEKVNTREQNVQRRLPLHELDTVSGRFPPVRSWLWFKRKKPLFAKKPHKGEPQAHCLPEKQARDQSAAPDQETQGPAAGHKELAGRAAWTRHSFGSRAHGVPGLLGAKQPAFNVGPRSGLGVRRMKTSVRYLQRKGPDQQHTERTLNSPNAKLATCTAPAWSESQEYGALFHRPCPAICLLLRVTLNAAAS